MAHFNYPYTDFHEMNLDWVIAQIKKLHSDWDDFKVLNAITYAGTWDITKSYKLWSFVDDGNGMGYLSIKPVPAGILLDNEDYWRLVANYSVIFADFQNRLIALENKVNNIYRVFKTSGDLLQADLNEECYVKTLGFYSEGDNGGCIYHIVTSEPLTYHLTLNNGLFAEPVVIGIAYPEMFGAYGDDTNDDTTALNVWSLYDNIALTPDKTYLITNVISIHGKTVLNGNGAVIHNNGNHMAFLSDNFTPNTSISDILIENVRIVGNGTETTSWPNTNGAIIIAHKASNITIQNCVIENVLYGIFAGGEASANCKINYNHFINCGSSIDTYCTNYGEVIGNTIKGNKSGKTPIQIEPASATASANNMIVSHNIIQESLSSLAIVIHAHSHNIEICNNYCDKGINVDASNADYSTGIVVHDNIFKGKSFICGKNPIFRNNRCYGVSTTDFGFEIRASAIDVVFENMYIEGFESAIYVGGAGPDIYIDGLTTKTTLCAFRYGSPHMYINNLTMLSGSVVFANISAGALTFTNYKGVCSVGSDITSRLTTGWHVYNQANG